MVRILLCKNIIYHKCVHCGIAMDYDPVVGGYCHICKSSQRLRTSDRKTDLPFDFLIALADFARVTYHVRPTNA
jgi:hypothetical protein